jgi:TonB family protein
VNEPGAISIAAFIACRMKHTDHTIFLVGFLTLTSICSHCQVQPQANSRSRALPKVTGAPNFYYSVKDALKKKDEAEGLSLVGKQLEKFPREVLKLSNLKYLDLESNNLRGIPAEIHALSKLQELYLSHNQIGSLPPTISTLTELKALGLAFNQLNSFPAEITKLKGLVGLDLSDNKLSALPPDIEQLQNLEILSLANNKIKELPANIYDLRNLKQLDVFGTDISIDDLQKLKASRPELDVISHLNLATDESEEIFTMVEVSAGPVGGIDAFYAAIASNMQYPPDARRAGIDGKVFVEFIVDKDGSIPPDQIRVVKGLSPSLDAEAIRVIRESSVKWTPGIQHGKSVKQRMVLPVTFTLGTGK